MADQVGVSFDDVEALQRSLSDEFGPWGADTTVDQALIDSFAEMSGDHQWIHTDVDRARSESPFGTTIAHGFLLLALLPRIRSQSVSVLGYKSALNYGSDKLRFLTPVPAGASIHSRSRLAAVEARSGGTLLTTEVEVAVLGAQKPSLLYRMQVLYRG